MLVPFIFLCGLMPRASAADDWWEEFSNNLATDLTPIISLFGEAPTKQFLSESLTLLDYIIFAMAPLGVLTAVVSTIRVSGGSSLRAFIGRSKEGMGVIEAELCPSTSRDVCELYNNGGIARVMGRPQILEVVYNRWAPHEEFFDTEEKAVAGVHSVQSYFQKVAREPKSDTWEEVVPRWGGLFGYKRKLSKAKDDQNVEAQRTIKISNPIFAPYPNLTLNIWMKKPSSIALLAATIIGAIAQSGVIAYGAVATYSLKYKKNDAEIPAYGFPLMASGTIALCFGIFLCAFYVGVSTAKRTFRRTGVATKSLGKGPQAEFVWMQPGGQRIGDQTFDAFAYSDANDPLNEYTSAWKSTGHGVDEFAIRNERRPPPASRPGYIYIDALRMSRIIATCNEIALYAAIILSTIGFILQFIGLRALHSSVSIVQLAAILLMSFIRSLLRTQRLEPSKNVLEGVPEFIHGHELDWLALYLAREDIDHEDVCGEKCTDTVPELSLTHGLFPLWVHSLLIDRQLDQPRYPFFRYSTMLLQDNQDWDRCSAQVETARGQPLLVCGSTKESSPPFDQRLFGSKPSLPRKVFAIRKRLAQLTGERLPQTGSEEASQLLPASMQNWSTERVSVRQQARSLSLAIQRTADILFTGSSKFSEDWKNVLSFCWPIDCSVMQQHCHSAPMYLTICRKSTTKPWVVDEDAMEALLGLWLWSLRADPRVVGKDQGTMARTSVAPQIPNRRIICLNVVGGSATPDINTWMEGIGQTHLNEIVRERGSEPWGRAMLYGPSDLFWLSPKADKFNARLSTLSYSSPSFTYNEEFLAGVVRFFGWNCGINTTKQLFHLDKFYMKYTTTDSSLLQLCAQDIFASFVQALFHVVDTIGGTTDIEFLKGQGLRLYNTEITRILGAFQESNLGSYRDALITTLPAIGTQNLRTRELIFEAVRVKVKTLRREGRWEDASALLWKAHDRLRVDGPDYLTWSKSNYLLAGMSLLVFEHLRLDFFDRSPERHGRSAKWETEFKSACAKLESPFVDVEGRPTVECLLPHALVKCYEEASSSWGKPFMPDGYPMESNSLYRLTENFRENLRWLGNPECELSRTQLTNNLFFAVQGGLNGLNVHTTEEWKDLAWSILVDTLLELGADVDHKDDKFKRTPLSYAAEKGRKLSMEVLLEAGANPNSKGADGKTPLHHAAACGHFEICKMLLQLDRVTVCVQDERKCTPLTYAVIYKHDSIVKLIVNSRRVSMQAELLCLNSPNLEGLGSITPEDIARALIAVMNFRLINSVRLVYAAIKNGRFNMAKMLIEDPFVNASGEFVPEIDALGRVSPAKPDGHGFFIQAAEDGQLQILEYLLARREDDVDVHEGSWALKTAAFKGRKAVVEFLYSHPRITVEAEYDGSYSATIYAAEAGHADIVDFLLNTGEVSVNRTDNGGATALVVAAREGHLEVVKRLLRVPGVDVNMIIDRLDETALMHAAWGNHIEMLRLLLAAGADTEPKDYGGRTAMDLAKEAGHQEVISALEDWETRRAQTTAAAVAQPATPEPATPQPATPQPATPQPATPQPATPQPATPQPATPQLATTRPATPPPAKSESMTLESVSLN
ncbi:hypothetical protein AJ80_06055 [Polytolypa hystricis UAMH7299]|uniref:Uncharacterized protein n=1 Tax=Polytolypa hystricis (strain UAMH7299) TaxID=1447883 RepID=A0A2B7XZ45_POLH7|nr:hypothetical protein AJ80_06055 [Polytolypa hystricis UAMH7299]